MNLKPKIFDKQNFSFRVDHKEENASYKIGKQLAAIVPINKHKTDIIYVCVGSDRSTGDALGPLVGSKLKENNPSNFHVYGTLDDPVHAVNLEEHLTLIRDTHPNSLLIGIDACLGRLKSVGHITLNDGPLKPGAGVNKQLPEVGELHLTGIVNVSGFMEYLVLQNTRLSLVMNMANAIAEGIMEAHTRLERRPEPSRLSWKLL